MSVAMPLPYDGESLYSVIARYLEAANITAPTFALNTLFGTVARPKKELICSLAEFSRQTDLAWGLSALEIAQRYTVAPYYAVYSTQSRRTAAYAAITARDGIAPAVILQVNKSPVARNAGLRYCPRCAMEDVLEGRRPCWRRVHQLPGVFICPYHRVPLLSVRDPRATKSGVYRLDPAEHVSSWRRNAEVQTAMEISADALVRSEPQPHLRSAETEWLQLAADRGFVKANGYVDTEAIVNGLTEMYGGAYLEATGLDMSRLQPNPWPARLIRCRNVAFHPLQYILLGNFLERCDNTARRIRADLAPSKARVVCPNQYASHPAGHIIDHIRTSRTIAGKSRYHGHCRCCGIHFTFSGCSADTNIPNDVQVTQYGKDLCGAVQTMRNEGLSFPAIERAMGLPPRAARRMLQRPDEKPRARPTREQLLEWRCEWKELLRSVAPEGHLAAAMRNKYLYNRLCQYDKEWLTQCAARYENLKNQNVASEWARRDQAYKIRLQRAAATILSAGPSLVRASKVAIAAKAGLSVRRMSIRHKLPLCDAVLAELAESAEEFQVRRLEAARQTLVTADIPVTRWKLLRQAGISRVKNTAVAATVDRLIDRHSQSQSD
ncbi:hypothetical protein AWB75_04137 [Caballeronia catudaia]|uniref:Uncharacterized protein n=1 Tax=Caballeronia catudaia TaxID=1777136 RepID=A0A158BXI6_9BURK|nr:TnsD family Tn7-like transposition protein [Caballeronia catudaia]SAK74366.1 hypothetical protein AWB75_04137 [Caballeronia catudaia]